MAAAAGFALALARPRSLVLHRDRRPRRRPPASLSAWLGLVALAGGLAGLGAGIARLTAIDRGAYIGTPGERVSVRGFVDAVPRRSGTTVRVRVRTADGRLLLSARPPVPELPVGREVSAEGVVRAPASWEEANLARQGVQRVVAVKALRLRSAHRGGLAALADSIRERAEAALERGTEPASAALLRGFVLGQDDRIESGTAEEFRRSGLAHLLAVSGQNVLLLALLAAPILALLGVPLRARLICLLALIALYVPVTGAGPSIQRAGVMGAAGITAALASRPASRWYAVLLAATVTLAFNPRTSGDVGWQLSFAAVLGILALGAPLRAALLGLAGSAGARVSVALAEGGALTLAATAATAPLMAHHFGAVSLAALPANLIALPAVAPVMWLGMLVSAMGQVPWLPVEPLTALAGLLASYIAQVAAWLSAPGWAQPDAELSAAGMVAAYAVLAACLVLALSLAIRYGGLRPGRRAALGLAPLVLAGPAIALAGALVERSPAPLITAQRGLAVRFLDVGQGDSIVLIPSRAPAILVDTGPPGAGVAERLGRLGITRLAAAVVTHDEWDHAGGLEEVLGEISVGSLVHSGYSRRLPRIARRKGIEPVQVGRGDVLRSGGASIEVLWPPDPPNVGGRRGPVGVGELAGTDPNARSLVLLTRWRGFGLLLTGDAEAVDVPLNPGEVDVLKVAHHGSADPGLPALLGPAAPGLAVISVGDENPFGHPAPETLATLREHGARVIRTDESGDVTIRVGATGFAVQTDR